MKPNFTKTPGVVEEKWLNIVGHYKVLKLK